MTGPAPLRAADLVARRLYEAGCRLAFGDTRKFKHNDLADLEGHLQRGKAQGRGKQRREALRKTVHGRVRKWQLRPRKGIDPRGCKGAPVLHGELDETLRVVEGTVQHHAGPIAPGVDALHGRVHALRANSGVAH